MKPRITNSKMLITGIVLLLLSTTSLIYFSDQGFRLKSMPLALSAIILILSIVLIQIPLARFFGKREPVEDLAKLNDELERRVLEMTSELAISKKALTETFERISNAFIALDTTWCYTYVNKKAGEIFQREPGEMIGQNIWTEFPENTDRPFYQVCNKAFVTQQYIYSEEYHPDKDLWLENHIYPSPQGLSIFFCDITEQKKSEKQVNKLNRLYFFISHINHMIARTTDEITLFKEACDIAVKIGKFKMAWIGLIDETSKILNPAIYSDIDPDFLTATKILAGNNSPEASGPSAMALREGKYIYCNDIEAHPGMAPWRTEALKRNFRSSIALPIKKSGKVIGTFNLYAGSKNFFDAQEIALLQETTGDISFALDVFEKEAFRKKAELAVSESERRYQTLAEVCPVGIFHTDAAGFTTYVNPCWCQVSGLTREEALGNGWFKAVHEEDKEALSRNWLESTRIQDVSLSEYRFMRPDGTTAWVIGQATPEWNSDNQVVGYVGTTTDITRRKKAEEEIRKANDRFELISKATNDVIWDWNLLTDEIWWNSNYYSLFGYEGSSGFSSILTWKTHIHPEDQERVLHELTRAIDSGETHWNDEYRYLKKDGTIVFIYDRGFISHDESGQAYRMMGSMLNLTELKKAQDEIIKEKNLSDSIINSLPGIFYLFNKEGKNLRWNMNFEKVTLYNAQEIRELHPLDFFDEEEKELVSEKISNTFIYGEENLQANFLLKSKQKIPYYFTGKAIDYEGSPCIMGVGIDFSERLKAQDKIEQTSEQLRQLALHLQTIREEERKRIGREIHDELGQQLTAIKMDIAWIDKKIPEGSTLLKSKLINVNQLLDGSNQSIRRILSELRAGILDDHGLLEAIQWLGRQFTANTGIPVKFQITDTEIRSSTPVANCIFRVYQEAFTNITRYAMADEVSTSINIIDDSILVLIEDNGKGFDIASIKHEKSFGILGMKERVHSLGGTFELISSPGIGTRINIRLPGNISQKN